MAAELPSQGALGLAAETQAWEEGLLSCYRFLYHVRISPESSVANPGHSSLQPEVHVGSHGLSMIIHSVAF